MTAPPDFTDNATQAWRPRTLEVRGYQLAAIAEAIPVLVAATDDDLMAWFDTLTGSKETIAQYVSAISGLYRWMVVKRKLRRDNPALVLDRPRIPPRLPRPMMEKHYQLALACALSEPDLYLWLGLMGCSGLRCCEIAWLMVYDVEERDDGSGIARLVGKGGKRRAVPIGENLMLTLRPFLDRPAGSVFVRPDGSPWPPGLVSRRVNRFLREIKIPDTAHSLRHRFGTDYHAIDADVFRQAQVMGHSSINSTLLYTQVDPTVAAEHVAALTRRRFGTSPGGKVVRLRRTS